MNNTTSGIAGLVLGILIGVFIVPTFYTPSFGPGSGMMNYGMRSGFGGNLDRHFIEQMIPHHDGAIAMAELALEKSKRPEILSLANGIIEAQETEIEQMNGWYKEWFGKEPTDLSGISMGMMHGGMHMDGMTGDLERLANATDFDLEFIRQMIPHHEMAVMMAQMLLSGTDREEMKVLADQITTSQSREIEMMRSWYSAWSN